MARLRTALLPCWIRRLFPLAAAALALGAAGGPPREAGPFREPDLVEIVTLDPTIHLDIRYARADNFIGRPVYKEARAFLQRPAAEALARVERSLRDRGFGLLVFDGYRPWAVTKTFWDLTPPDKHMFVADPAQGSRHNRGCAVDLSLYDLKSGKAVEMPSGYDETSDRAYPTYAGGDAAARERRDLLREAMEKEGFFVYAYEWWHFDYKDWRDYPVLDIPFESLGGAGALRAAGAAAPIDVARARVVDLTYTFDATTLYWPTSPSAFELTRLSFGRVEGGWFYASNSFCAPEHGGTHLDAPIHFAEHGWTTEQIPLRRLMAPAVVVDVGRQAEADRDYRLTPDDLRAWEAAHGAVPKGAIVLLRTGWGPRWPDRKRYFGDDTPGDASHLHFPSYGKEAAGILVGDRGVAALGVDTASIDYGPSKDFAVHQVAMLANVPGLENVANLDQLPATGAFVVALPMKIGGGSGGPLRIVAFLPD
jgi:D-alanyl-D-alanine dipeptidase/kynurenine formamidase